MSVNLATAYHEAGHAVVTIVLGGSFTTCVITPDDERQQGVIEGMWVPGGAGSSCAALAGPIAEMRWILGSGASPTVIAQQRVALAVDIADQVQVLLPLAGHYLAKPIELINAYVEDHRPIAETLVTAYWPAIEKVAARLAAGATITPRDVIAFLYDSCPLGAYPLAA